MARKKPSTVTIHSLHNERMQKIDEISDIERAREEEIEYLLASSKVMFEYHNKTSMVSRESKTLDDIATDRLDGDDLLNKYIIASGAATSHNPNRTDACPRCESCFSVDVVVNHDDMMLHCMSCNIVTSVSIDVNLFNSRRIGAPTQNSSESNYAQAKRRAHLSDWIMSIQGHKTVDIPSKVYELINRELVKMRYMTPEGVILQERKITDICIHTILKMAKLGKYYDSVAFIRTRITGVASAFLPADVENKVKSLFDIISESYEKYKHTSDGKTLTSYAFIIRKLLEKLGNHDHLHKFKLVKSKNKLNEYNIMWRHICRDHDWEYVASY